MHHYLIFEEKNNNLVTRKQNYTEICRSNQHLHAQAPLLKL